jgi:hypothetical protein
MVVVVNSNSAAPIATLATPLSPYNTTNVRREDKRARQVMQSHLVPQRAAQCEPA